MLRRIDGIGTREDGFSLVEVVIASLIVAVGLLAIGLAQLSSMRMTSRSKQMSQAIYLAQEQIETFQAMPASDPTFSTAGEVIDPNTITLGSAGDEISTFRRRYTITPNQPSAGLTTVTVTVDWMQGTKVAETSSVSWIKGN